MPVSRRHFFFGSLALPALAARKPAPERPNIVLFLLDSLPSWVLGCYGNKEVQTPNLDRLAQTGTRFLNHFACTPAPALSRATLLTGRTPMQLGDAENPPANPGSLDQVIGGLGYATGAAETAAASQFLDGQAAGKPFFLTLGYPALRPPYDGVARKYRDLYAQTRFETLNLERVPAANAQSGKEMLSDIIGNLRQVAAAVTALDAEAGAVMARLSQRNLIDQTLVIFTSTSGALLGRHGLWDAGQASDPVNMFEEAVAVPMFWSWPGRIPAQAVRPEMVSAYDLAPSVCDILSVEYPNGNPCGRSYLPLATGKPLPKKHPWRATVFGHYRTTDMARVERYKLVQRAAGKGPGELYDLVADPFEKVNQHDNPQFVSVRNTLASSAANWKKWYSA